MFQSSADRVLVLAFAVFLAVAFAVVAAGSREQARRGRRPGAPIRVESQRAAYYEWIARHERRRHYR